MRKNTVQKQVILDYLKNTKTHPTAEEVYQKTKKKLPFISRGTVYRHLNHFVQKGDILELALEDAKRFDGDTTPHYHFLCLNCGKVYDIMDKNSSKNLKNIFKKIHRVGKINNFQINFFGTCKECQN